MLTLNNLITTEFKSTTITQGIILKKIKIQIISEL